MEKINKIGSEMKVEVGRPQKKYQVILKDTETGETLYQWDSFAGIVCNVEEVKSFGADMEGNHQVLGWGHPMAQFYALDQLKRWFKNNGEAFIDTVIKSGVIKGDMEWLKKMFKKD